MAQSTLEARAQILDELASAVDQTALAMACLGEAVELVAVGTAERLEGQLFRPVQRAYARGKRTHAAFAGRVGLETRDFDLPEAGAPSQGVKAFVERAATATTEADRMVAELQDSLLPVESGDPELRAGLGSMREALASIPLGARELLRGLGR